MVQSMFLVLDRWRFNILSITVWLRYKLIHICCSGFFEVGPKIHIRCFWTVKRDMFYDVTVNIMLIKFFTSSMLLHFNLGTKFLISLLVNDLCGLPHATQQQHITLPSTEYF